MYDLTRGTWEIKTYSGNDDIKAKNVEVCSIVLVEEVGGAAVAEELAGRSWLERRPPPEGTNQTPCQRQETLWTVPNQKERHENAKKGTKRQDLSKRGPRGQCLEPKECLVCRNGRV